MPEQYQHASVFKKETVGRQKGLRSDKLQDSTNWKNTKAALAELKEVEEQSQNLIDCLCFNGASGSRPEAKHFRNCGCQTVKPS